MRVITNVGIGSVQPGRSIELPDAEAEYLVRHGFARLPKTNKISAPTKVAGNTGPKKPESTKEEDN